MIMKNKLLLVFILVVSMGYARVNYFDVVCPENIYGCEFLLSYPKSGKTLTLKILKQLAGDSFEKPRKTDQFLPIFCGWYEFGVEDSCALLFTTHKPYKFWEKWTYQGTIRCACLVTGTRMRINY